MILTLLEGIEDVDEFRDFALRRGLKKSRRKMNSLLSSGSMKKSSPLARPLEFFPKPTTHGHSRSKAAVASVRLVLNSLALDQRP